jgi:hypothetical protein
MTITITSIIVGARTTATIRERIPTRIHIATLIITTAAGKTNSDRVKEKRPGLP